MAGKRIQILRKRINFKVRQQPLRFYLRSNATLSRSRRANQDKAIHRTTLVSNLLLKISQPTLQTSFEPNPSNSIVQRVR